MQYYLVELIRNALLDNPNRNDAYVYIQDTLGVSRHKAKALVFAWIYRAEEPYLQHILADEGV